MNEQQILAAFNAITQSTEQLRGALATQQTRSDEAMQAVARQLQQHSTALTESVRQNAEFLQNETQARKREGMVDSKAVQKPERFSGKDADWASWAYKFTTWVETQQE